MIAKGKRRILVVWLTVIVTMLMSFVQPVLAINWLSATAQVNGSDMKNHLNEIIYDGSRFIVVGDGGKVYSSVDGLNWNNVTITHTNNMNGAVYASAPYNKYLMVGAGGALQLSADGTTWTSFTSSANVYNAAAFGGVSGTTKYLAVGNGGLIRVNTGASGAGWSAKNLAVSGASDNTANLYGAAAGPVGSTTPTNGFVIVGDNGLIKTNVDAATAGSLWVDRKPAGFSTPLRGVAYVNNTYIAVGDAGKILTSPDGITWTEQASGTTQNLYGIAYGSVNSIGYYVVVGDNGTMLTSVNGAAWMVENIGTSNHLRSVVYANDRFFAVGSNGVIVYNPILNTNSSLSGLSYSAISSADSYDTALDLTGNPPFFTSSVTNKYGSILVTPTAADANATVKINGIPVANGQASSPISLNAGINTVAIAVYAQAYAVDSTSMSIYTMNILRSAALSTNASLSNILPSSGSLSPAFSNGQTEYSVSVGSTVSEISITPTASHAGATVTINGVQVASGSASAPISLVYGSNTITVLVRAEDTTSTKFYTLTVNRQLPGYFSENFDGGTKALWYEYGGTGSIFNEGGNNIYNFKYAGDIAVSFYYGEGKLWKDYSYEAKIRINSSLGNGGLAFGVLDENNFYHMRINDSNKKAELVRRVNGGNTSVIQASPSVLPFNAGEWHTLRVDVTGNSVKGYLDNVQVIDWTQTDNMLPLGNKIGIRTQADISADDIQVVPLNPPDIQLTMPMPYSVFQRSDSNVGAVKIEGFINGHNITRVEARAVVMKDVNPVWTGTDTGWMPITYTSVGANTGLFSGIFPVAAGGWYQIEVKGYQGTTEVVQAVCKKVGVGEIFLVGGQSNSGNSGGTRLTPSDDRVAAVSRLDGSWAFGKDPMHGLNGNMGSSWSVLGDLLVQKLGVPVAFCGYGKGGTVVQQWVPGTADSLYPRLQEAIHTVAPYGGARAVLWHQGETDSDQGTTAQQYEERLTSVIHQSRLDAAWNPNVPWGIAIVSYSPYSVSRPERMQAVAQGHINTANNVPDCFIGPTTDDLVDGYRRMDEISHLNEAGQREHGKRWSENLFAEFFSDPTSADLTSLTMSEGTLSPAFDSAVTTYDASVANSVGSIIVTPTAVNNGATVKVNGTVVHTAFASLPIPLEVGINTVSVAVYAKEGTATKTYTLHVQRLNADPGNADLSGLSISTGSFVPAFDSAITSYTMDVTNDISSITVTPVTYMSGSTVKVNGVSCSSGAASEPIALNVGQNIISVVVYSNDASVTKTYSIVINRADPGLGTLSSVLYANGGFVAVGGNKDTTPNGIVKTSVDGSAWTLYDNSTPVSISTLQMLNSITYGNGYYVAVGNTGTMIITTDTANTSWTAFDKTTRPATGTSKNLYGVGYANGRFVAVGAGGTVVTTTDLSNFTMYNNDLKYTYNGIKTGTSKDLNAVAFGNGTFVIAGNDGSIVVTKDFLSFSKYDGGTLPSTGVTNHLYSVTFGNGLFAAVGAGGSIITSPDGITWTVQSSGITQALRAVSFLNNKFIAVGDNGTVLVSDDGIVWMAAPVTNPTVSYRGVAFANNQYLLVGSSQTAELMDADIRIAVDKTQLHLGITQAKALYEAAVEGYEVGNYVIGAISALQTATEAAEAIAEDPEVEQREVNLALSTLNTQISRFNRLSIGETTGDLNADGEVAIGDLTIAGARYLKNDQSADWLYIKGADFNQDGVIDLFDLTFIAKRILK